MRSPVWMASVLAAVAFAAPDYAPVPGDGGAVNKYFQLLATQVLATQNMDAVPECDLSQAQMPSAPALPSPTGLVLKHVAIGRGTQNYTCGSNDTAPPTAVGAVANLYNASCLASVNLSLLRTIPGFALQFQINNTEMQDVLAPANLDFSGKHEFLNLTTPFFNLDLGAQPLGEVALRKNATAAAPAGAPVGQAGKGLGAVPWLQLLAIPGSTGDLAQVYRINTAGGLQPATCAGMPAAFEVEYAAEYWFFETP